MENGNNGFSAADAVLTSAMSGGFNRGGGQWGDGYYGIPYANDATIQHGIHYNRQSCENQADCTREVLGSSMDNNARAFESANVQRQFERVCDRISQGELRNGDRLRDIEREMAANAREAAACCCKLERQACEDKAQIIAEIKASEGRSIERNLNAANAELTALKTQIACGCVSGCSTPCPTPCHG